MSIVFSICLLAPLTTRAQDSESGGHPARSSLTAQAGDPTAPLVQFQITDFFAFSSYYAEGYANYFNFEPVIPIKKSSLIPRSQVLRFTLPVITTAGPRRRTGLGDLAVVDLLVSNSTPWGVWGLGASAVAPTASNDELGQGKWQLGPAATLVYYKVPGWQLGGLFQNPISFAGDRDRPSVNTFQFQPLANYMKGDWYVGAGDFNWTYDWKSREWTVPLAFQVGQIRQIGKHKYNLSFEFEWTAVRPDESVVPKWGVRLGLVLLLPE